MEIGRVLETLRAHRAELEVAGVVHAGVFGSVARGEAGPGSDTDVLVEFAPGVYRHVGIKDRIAALMPGQRVDVVNAGGMRPTVRERVMRALVPAF